MTHGSEHFTVSVTAERLGAAAPLVLEAAKFWSRRFVRRWNASLPNRHLYQVSVFCAWLIAVLAALLALVLPTEQKFEYSAYAVAGLAYALILYKAGYQGFAEAPDRLHSWIQRRTGGGLMAWRIRRVFAATIKKAPFNIQYEISTEGIRSTCRELDSYRFLRVEQIDSVHLTPELLLVVAREKFRKRIYPIYLDDNRFHAAVQKFLAAHRIAPTDLTEA